MNEHRIGLIILQVLSEIISAVRLYTLNLASITKDVGAANSVLSL